MKFIFLFSIIFLFYSCGEKSLIVPLYQEQSAAEQQKSTFYTVSGTYTLEDIDVKKTIEGPIIFKDIGSLLADIIIAIGGGIDVKMEAVPVDLTDIDLEIIKEAIIDTVSFEIIKEEKSKKASLKFIKNLRIYISNGRDLEPKEENWLIKYDRSEPLTKKRSKACEYKCLKFAVNKINLLKFSSVREPNLYIMPFLEVGKTSKRDFTLRGKVKFKLKLLLPI